MQLQITPINNDAVVSGVSANYRGVDLRIARSNNEKFKAAFRRLSKKYQQSLATSKRKTIDPVELDDVATKAMAEAILVGWEPFEVKGPDGEPVVVEYSIDNAYNLLTNDVDAREFVSNFANDIENYLLDEEEALLGE